MDVLPSEIIMNKIFTFNNDEDIPLNDAFDQAGFPFTNAMRNMGSTFFYLVIDLAAMLALCLTVFCSGSRFSIWLRNKIMWNYFIRFMI
jgi:hypothetical protein